MDEAQRHIQGANLRYLRLYGNMEILGMSLYGYTRGDMSLESRLRLNIIQAVADTLAAKISKNKPKPTFLTSGGDYSAKRKSRQLDDFCQGLFYFNDVYSSAQEIFLDAGVWGTGVGKVYEKDGYPCLERIICDEIKFDLADAFYGFPRCCYHVKFYNREVLLDMFPKKREIIIRANAEENKAISLSNLQLTDQVKVIEAWHLPSGGVEEGVKNDGRHVIAIENGTLTDPADEEWNKNYFPLVFLKLMPKRIGFWAQGVSENLTPLQIETNKLLRTLQVSMHLTSIPKVLLDANSQIVDNHINNEIGGVIKYSGIKPEYWAGGAIPQELFRQIDWNWQKGFEQFGMSALSATSQKPAGLNAGVALREYNDIETERFVLIGQRYEQFFVDLAKQFIPLCKEIAMRPGEDGKPAGMTVKSPMKRELRAIKWSEIDLDDKDYMIRIFPTSSLPTRPEARLQTVQELTQAGMIPPDEALELLDFPDLESYMHRKNAAIEDIERTIEMMIDKGEYLSPEPYQNLSLGITMVQQSYLKARMDKVPEQRLELLRTWMADAQDTLDKMTQASAAPSPGPMNPGGSGGSNVLPLAKPMPTPTSEMVPNVQNMPQTTQ